MTLGYPIWELVWSGTQMFLVGSLTVVCIALPIGTIMFTINTIIRARGAK